MLPPEHFHPDVEDMMGRVYPEDFGDGMLYWNYLAPLVLRGALERACAVLMKHSYFAAAETAIKVWEASIQAWEKVCTDFRMRRDVLLLAPLPGGRN